MKPTILTACLAFAAIWATSASLHAAMPEPYSKEALQEAMEADKPIVLDFKASWCPVCQRQGRVLEQLLAQEKFSDLVVFTVDYDKEKELKRQYRVTAQSTLIVLRGDKEVDRATGITNPAAIEKLISAAS